MQVTAGKIVEGHEPPATIQPFASGRFSLPPSSWVSSSLLLFSSMSRLSIHFHEYPLHSHCFLSGFQCLAGKVLQSPQTERFLNRNIWYSLPCYPQHWLSATQIFHNFSGISIRKSLVRSKVVWFSCSSQVFYVNQEKNLKVLKPGLTFKGFEWSEPTIHPSWNPLFKVLLIKVICEWTGAGVTTMSSRCCSAVSPRYLINPSQ